MDYNYIHCPNLVCDARLSPDHQLYYIKTENGVKYYRCPYCGMTFTAEMFDINSYPMSHDGHVLVIRGDELVTYVLFENTVLVGKQRYVHLHKSVAENSRVLIINPKLSEQELQLAAYEIISECS